MIYPNKWNSKFEDPSNSKLIKDFQLIQPISVWLSPRSRSAESESDHFVAKAKVMHPLDHNKGRWKYFQRPLHVHDRSWGNLPTHCHVRCVLTERNQNSGWYQLPSGTNYHPALKN
ncbi:hypothetical protein RRG08_046145 [Elysia crispata]|uniref:Uncharacterized protein n=1 Tax=Elysia crispata TaxID=231223 RepID=A0AAE1A2F2_9GAST|nr:hypothetical protein RRG08_046145 [Elysia crispata]